MTNHRPDVMNPRQKVSLETLSYRQAAAIATISFIAGLTPMEAKVCVHFYTLTALNTLYTLRKSLESWKGVIFKYV